MIYFLIIKGAKVVIISKLANWLLAINYFITAVFEFKY